MYEYLARRDEHTNPEYKLAQIGDIAIFECYSESEVVWTFDLNKELPKQTYCYRSNYESTFLVVMIIDESYYGHYVCEGEWYSLRYAFYSVVTLKQQ